jgi:hypothetical protein
MKKIFYLLVLAVVSLTSCDKNEVEVQSAQQIDAPKYIELKNNEELASVLQQLDSNKVVAQVIAGKSFHSMWDVYQEILNSDIEKQKQLIKQYPNVAEIAENDGALEINLKISDKAMAKVLSPNGLIKIGERIIKVENELTKVITNGDETLISKLDTATRTDLSSNILVEKNVRYTPRNQDNSKVGLQKSNLFEWSGYVYDGSSRRCKWVKFIDYNPVFDYASVGGSITFQKKTWGMWFSASQAMSLHILSRYLYCTHFSYDAGRLNIKPDGSPINLYAVSYQNYNSLDVIQRFWGNTDEGCGNVESGHVEIDFTIWGRKFSF